MDYYTKLLNPRKENYVINTNEEDIEVILADLNPVQKQVAKVTKEFCRVLDSTRPLSDPIRMDLLDKVYKSLNFHKNKAEEINNSDPQTKRKLTNKLLRKGKDKSIASRLQYL